MDDLQLTLAALSLNEKSTEVTVFQLESPQVLEAENVEQDLDTLLEVPLL